MELATVFPSCPMCLGVAFDEVKERAGIRYRYKLRCTTCDAQWQIEEHERYANLVLITLLAIGLNPRGLELHPVNEPADQHFWDGVRSNNHCSQCKSQCVTIRKMKLRTGGVSGPTMFWFGTGFQFSEKTLPVDVWFCPRCRHIDFYEPPDEGFFTKLLTNFFRE